MAKKKRMTFTSKRKLELLIATIIIIFGLVLLIINRSQPKELEYSIKFHEDYQEIYIGDSRKFGYTITNPKGNDMLMWTTSNRNVASVDAYGNITGISFGDVTITVTLDNGSKSEMKIRVKSYPVYLKAIKVPDMYKGWYSEKVTVTLEKLNVEDIKYCISEEESCYENKEFKDKVVIDNGTWYLNIKGIDKNGKEVTLKEYFKVDLVPPKCNITRIGKFGEENANAEVICEEDASGIDRYVWYRDNERIDTTVDRQYYLSGVYLPGKHKYSVRVYDLVGNFSTYEVD